MVEPSISRGDLEGAVRRTIGDIGDRVGERRPSLIAVTTVIGLGIVALVYQLGRRMGRFRAAIVEVRRL